MGSVNHETRPVQVWVDADLGIAAVVEHLNTIEGVRTHASCQGSVGEGGPAPYGPYVDVSWPDERTLETLKSTYVVEVKGLAWGTVHPRNPSAAEMAEQVCDEMIDNLRHNVGEQKKRLGDSCI